MYVNVCKCMYVNVRTYVRTYVCMLFNMLYIYILFMFMSMCACMHACNVSAYAYMLRTHLA